MFAAALGLSGCQDTNSAPSRQHFGTSESRDEMNDEHFHYALRLLHTMDELQADSALNTVVARLQEWRKHKQPQPDWAPDPLLETLPAELRAMPEVKSLAELNFTSSDGLELQQTVWLSEIAKRARGEERGPVAIAQALFDWVVRNIQLERDGTIEVPHLPRDTLLFGRGTAADRAWVFALLCRQQGLDVVMLAFPGKQAGDPPRLWLPALAVDGELYLFDTRLGLPIPGPDGKPVATFKDVLENEALLRQMDVDKTQRAYPVRAADLAKLVVLLEASPASLSQRMQLVASELPGKEAVVLTTEPSAVAERVKNHPHIESVKLWALPYERLSVLAKHDPEIVQKAQQELDPFKKPVPTLWRARVLHLLGNYSGEQGAGPLYQRARPADADLKMLRASAKPNEAAMADADLARLRAAKQSASYWLGLMAYERGNYPSAIDYLETRTLNASPDGPWTAGARYNLGRTYEALGKTDDAIRYYKADLSAQRNGNLLRARRLEEQAKKPAAKGAAGGDV